MKNHILITGGARRVGRTLTLALARTGWDITLHFNTAQEEAAALAQEVEAMGRHMTCVQADFEKEAEVARLIATLTAPSAPPLTAILHNASLFVHDKDDPDGTRHTCVNVEVPLRLNEALKAHLPQDGQGAVVHLLDATPMPPFLSRYAQSREALQNQLPALARAAAPSLRINGLLLGPTLKNERQSPDHFQKLVDQTPLRRASTPEDVAHAALALLENPCITGQILAVDSGVHLLAQK